MPAAASEALLGGGAVPLAAAGSGPARGASPGSLILLPLAPPRPGAAGSEGGAARGGLCYNMLHILELACALIFV